MRRMLEELAEGAPIRVEELAPDLRQLAMLMARMVLDLDEKVELLSKQTSINYTRLEEQLTKQGEVLAKIPRQLTHEKSHSDFIELQQRVNLMWIIGKWAVGGAAAGGAWLLGQAALKALGLA